MAFETPKRLLFDVDARSALRRGAQALSQTVAITLGPAGRHVLLDKRFGAPTVTSDGVTIARDIELGDPYENMGAQLVKEAAVKTNDIAGDGTTTATVLAEAIIREGMLVIATGGNPVLIKRGIDHAVGLLVEHLEKAAHPVRTRQDFARVPA